MEGPRHKEIKSQLNRNLGEQSGESETEEYNEEKDMSSIRKSLLQKKRYNPQKEEKQKKPIIKREFDKFIGTSRHIKLENKRNTENETLEKRISELEKASISFKKQLEEQKKEFKKQLEDQKKESKKQLEDQKEESKKQLEQQLEDQKKESEKLIDKLIKQINKLKENNSQILLEQKENYISLQIKVGQLQSQVNELSEFHFQVKLRKLLKNLIHYLFSNFYPKYMNFNKRTKKMIFDKVPSLPNKVVFLEKDKIIIINALNRLLDTIFIGAKKGDYVVHFVDPKTEINPYFKRYIKVFDNYDDFFKYFNINENDSNILIQIIPEQYFIEIDNFTFDKSIKELMNIYENNYFY